MIWKNRKGACRDILRYSSGVHNRGSRLIVPRNSGRNRSRCSYQRIYTEQVEWRDAATGKLLAASDYFSGMSTGALPEPGYGGLLYYMTLNGHIMALQVLPKPTNPTNATSSSTITSAPSENSISTK